MRAIQGEFLGGLNGSGQLPQSKYQEYFEVFYRMINFPTQN